MTMTFAPMLITKIDQISPDGWFTVHDSSPIEFSNEDATTTMIYKTCDFYNNISGNVQFKYMLSGYHWHPCDSYEPKYVKCLTSAYVYIIIDILVFTIMTSIFVTLVKLHRMISKILVSIFMILLLLSICINIYWLVSEKITNWLTNGIIFDVEAKLYINEYAVSINDQFTLAKTICQTFSSGVNLITVNITKCSQNNDESIILGSIIKLIAAVISVISVIYVTICDKKDEDTYDQVL
jgi:hypothetical protein